MDSLQKRIEQHAAATAKLHAEIAAEIDQLRKRIEVLETQRNTLIDQTQNALGLGSAAPATQS